MNTKYAATVEGQKRLMRAQAYVLKAQTILGPEFDGPEMDVIGAAVAIGEYIVAESNPYYDALLYNMKPREQEVEELIQNAFASIAAARAAQEAAEAAEYYHVYGYA
jgi:hypothetical protein